MQYNLDAFKDVDPNKIYNLHDEINPAITFYFNKAYHSAPFPDAHDDLLLKKEVFYDVFPNALGVITSFKIEDFLNYIPRDTDKPWLDRKLEEMKIDPKEFRKVLGSRKKADKYGVAIAGRFGEYKKDLVISLWQPESHPRFRDLINNPEFIRDVNRNFGRRFPMKEWILVPFGGAPRLFVDAAVAPPVSAEEELDIMPMPRKTATAYAASYKIGDHEFKIEDLKQLRGVLHSSTPTSNIYNAALSVLCHKDVQKYPELKGFVPANKCPQEDVISTKIDPYQINAINLYLAQKGSVSKPSTSLLYKPWRATSENYSFQSWLDYRLEKESTSEF